MRALAVGILLLSLTGCGYRFTAGGAPLPEGIREVHVPIFTNRTSESGVETVFTEALRERCTRSGVLGPATSEAQIEGEVRSVSGAPTILAYKADRSTELASYRIYATAYLRVVKNGRVLAETEINGQEDYLPDRIDGDVLRTETNRTTAIRRLAETLMRDGYERLTTGW